MDGMSGSIAWTNNNWTTCSVTHCNGTGADAPENGVVTKSNSNLHASVATFSCNNGFTFSGVSSVECNAANADAEWDTPHTAPTCRKDDDGLETWMIGFIAAGSAVTVGALAVAAFCRRKSKVHAVHQLDLTGDGKVDHIAIDTTGDGVPDQIVDLGKGGDDVKTSFNVKHDGKVDEVAIDTTGDGLIDTRMKLDSDDSVAKPRGKPAERHTTDF